MANHVGSLSIRALNHPDDFSTLKSVLKAVNPNSVVQIVSDDVITAEELKSGLDLTGDRKLTTDDFLMPQFNVHPLRFCTLEVVLKRHGMGMKNLVADWDRRVSHYCATGEAPVVYLESMDFLSEAMQKDGLAIRFLSSTRNGFGRLFLLAVQQNIRSISHVATPFLLMNPGLVKYVVDQNPFVIVFMSSSVQHYYSDLVELVIEKFPPLLLAVDPFFKLRKPDLLMDVVRQRGRDLALVGAEFQHLYPDIALQAVYRSEEAFESVSPLLKLDPAFQVKLVLSNFNLYGEFEKKFDKNHLHSTLWQSVKREVAALGIGFPHPMMESYDDFMAGLRNFDITSFPKRIRSFKTASELIQSRRNPFDDLDQRPVALFLYNSDDHNGGFDEYPVLDEFVREGFKVIYQEIQSDDEYFDLLDYYTRDGERPVHTLVVGGHGTSTSLHFASAQTSESDGDSEVLDTKDFQDCPTNSPILPGGQIFLYACGNARGHQFVENLANRVGGSYPNDITVIGQPVTGNIHEIAFDENHLASIKFWVALDDPASRGLGAYDVVDAYVQGENEERTFGLLPAGLMFGS